VVGGFTDGKEAEIVHQAVIEADSPDFIMRCLDFEHRIVIWAKVCFLFGCKF
jgi:hypothetical protein